MSTIHCHIPAPPPFNLYAATEAIEAPTIDKPRRATQRELMLYLDWLAARAGLSIPAHATYSCAGIYDPAKKEYLLDMPGYGQSQTVTCELLDEAGETVRRIVLPPDKAGKLPMTAVQAKDWTGLQAVRKPRATAKRAPVDKTPQISAPVAPPPLQPELDASQAGTVAALLDKMAGLVSTLVDRVASLETALSERVQPAPTVEAGSASAVSGEVLAARDAYISVLVSERDQARQRLEVEQAERCAEVDDLRARNAGWQERDLKWCMGDIDNRRLIRDLEVKRGATARRLLDTRHRAALDRGALAAASAEVRRLKPVADAILALSQPAAAPPGLRLVAA